jgi:hypothetical protein
MRTNQTYRYSCCGLSVETGLALPGWCEQPPGGAAPPDVRIEPGRVPSASGSRPAGRDAGPNWIASGDQLLLEVPGVARFQILAGNRIVYEPAPGRTPSDFAIFLMGSAFGALLHQRGCLVLHGSAVEVNGEAVLFCGASGAGKSSLAAALAAAGRRLVSDDVCAIRVRNGIPTLFSDGRALKLWADVVDHMRVLPGEPVRRGFEKYWVPLPSANAGSAALPVRQIYFLRDAAPPRSPGIEPLGLVDAAELLRRCAYRQRLIRVLGQDGHWLRQSLQLLSTAKAAWLTRERRLDALPESLAMLEHHWNAPREAAHAAA